jgi:hypothetical protein
MWRSTITIYSGRRDLCTGQDIIAGLQYSVGRKTRQQQFANLKEPMEFNEETGLPLQGMPQNNMQSRINNINFYFSATFNFETKNEGERRR